MHILSPTAQSADQVCTLFAQDALFRRCSRPAPTAPSRGLVDSAERRVAQEMLGQWQSPAAARAFAASRVRGRTSTHLAPAADERPGMTKYKLEYIWLDGYTPTPNLRGKTQIKEYAEFPTLEQLPLWGFDGSSTMQAEGRSSDCVLKPVRIFPDTERTNGALVLCEVMMPDGETPHPSNKRATILDDEGAWFGFEQEYFFYKNGRPLGFPEQGYPAPQGPYYTGVGYSQGRRYRAQDRRGASRPLPRRGHQPRGHQRRGGQGPVGVPDLRQGLQAGRRRDVDRPLSARAPDREVLHRHRVSLQAAGQHRLERLRHALQLLDHLPARGRRQGLFRAADGGVR